MQLKVNKKELVGAILRDAQRIEVRANNSKFSLYLIGTEEKGEDTVFLYAERDPSVADGPLAPPPAKATAEAAKATPPPTPAKLPPPKPAPASGSAAEPKFGEDHED